MEDEGRPASGDRADGPFLVAVKMGEPRRDPLPEVRVEQPLADQRGDGRALPERARQAYIGTLEQRRAAGLVERE